MATTTGFDLLAEYARELESGASNLPSTENLVEYWSGIAFMLNGVRYVAPMNEVAEVLSVPAFTRIPGVRSWIKGVSNVRGRLMAVMDLSVFLHQQAVSGKRQRLLVIDDDEVYTGMLVDEVLGMQHFPLTDYEAQWQTDDEVAPYIEGAYKQEDAHWPVFSMQLLAQDSRFMQAGRAQ